MNADIYQRVASTLSRSPWKVRRECCIDDGPVLGLDPDALADAIDTQLEAWREGGAV